MTDKTDIEALWDSAECMANLLDNLAGYEPFDIDMDTVELRFEDEGGRDTGCDISIVDTAQKSADIIRSLLDKLEAERQRAENLSELYHATEKSIFKIVKTVKGDAFDKYSHSTSQAIDVIGAELAALMGKQEPVGLIKRKTPLLSDGAFRYSFISDANLPLDTELFTRPPNPAVVLPRTLWYEHDDLPREIPVLEKNKVIAAIEAAGCVVKGGE